MKKIAAILSIVLIISVMTSCSRANDLNIRLDYLTIEKNTATILEDGDDVIYANNSGIYKKSAINIITQIVKTSAPNRLQMKGERIYFTDEDDRELNYVSKSGGEVKRVFSMDRLRYYREDLKINDYVVHKSQIYFTAGTELFCYDLKTDSLELIIGSDGVEVFQIENETLYFIDHAARTFTVYAMGLEDMQKKIVIGTGKTEPSEKICFDFLLKNENIFYLQRNPEGLYLQDVCVEDQSVSAVYHDGKELYYLVGEKLYRHESKGNVYLMDLIGIESTNSFLVVNDIAYYNQTEKGENSIVAKSIEKKEKTEKTGDGSVS